MPPTYAPPTPFEHSVCDAVRGARLCREVKTISRMSVLLQLTPSTPAFFPVAATVYNLVAPAGSRKLIPWWCRDKFYPRLQLRRHSPGVLWEGRSDIYLSGLPACSVFIEDGVRPQTH